MSLGDVFDTAFRLYRSNFVLFVTVTAAVMVPATALTLLAGGLLGINNLFADTQPSNPDDVAAVMRMLGALAIYSVASIIATLGYVAQYAAMIVAASARYLGVPCTLRAAYRRALACYGKLVAALLLASVVIGGVYFALIFVFAVFAAVGSTAVGDSVIVAVAAFSIMVVVVLVMVVAAAAVLAFLPQIIVLETEGIVGAFQRNFALLRVAGWRAVSGLGLAWVITSVLQLTFAASIAFSVGGLLLPFLRVTEETQTIILDVLASVVGLFIQPYLASALVVLYYDARVRNEALDLLWMVDKLPAVASGETVR